MCRSRFCASLLERRQSLDLFAVDESFPVHHYGDVAPDQPDDGLPLARTIGNFQRDAADYGLTKTYVNRQRPFNVRRRAMQGGLGAMMGSA